MAPPRFPHAATITSSAKTMSETKLVLHGTFIDTPSPGALRVREDTSITVDVASGRIQSITPRRSSSSSSASNTPDHDVARVERLTLGARRVVVPGFVDCHVHAPQYKQLGTKTDVPLMEWLEKYTFPAESAFSDPLHAKRVYTRLVRRLLRNGTTTAMYFGSNHLQASLILASICGDHGQRALVGKTASDQLLPDYYVETTNGSLRDTEQFVVGVREEWGDDEEALVQPVVTPRFVPTCSEDLLRGLGELVRKYGCHVQTHAAESVDQVALVRAQWPRLQRDIAILEEVGLLTDRTVLVHCAHLHDCEAKRMAERGTSIASCPYSNMLFARAVLPMNRFRGMGVKIGLGTDIAGGHSASMVDSVRMAGLVSRIHGFQPPKDRTDDPVDLPVSESPDDEEVVDWKTAFYMGTRGGATALGLRSVGAFEVGMKWDALEVDLTWDEDDVEIGIDGDGEDVEMKLERWICGHGGEGDVRNVWVDGKLVLERD